MIDQFDRKSEIQMLTAFGYGVTISLNQCDVYYRNISFVTLLLIAQPKKNIPCFALLADVNLG